MDIAAFLKFVFGDVDDDQVIGVVQLINKRDRAGKGPLPFTSEDAALIQPINHIVGGAIDRALMIERIQEQTLPSAGLTADDGQALSWREPGRRDDDEIVHDQLDQHGRECSARCHQGRVDLLR